MKNNKNAFDILCNILAYLFLAVSIALMFIGASSCSTPKSIIENTTIERDSVTSVIDTVSTSKEVKTFETVYKGIDEAFTVKPDSSGFIPEFKRSFNTGAVQGEIGYSKDKGSYYNIKAKDLKERNHEVKTDTTSKKETTTIDKTVIDRVAETVLITKKWGTFQWVTFIISLLVVIYIVIRVYKFITNPTGLLKRFF